MELLDRAFPKQPQKIIDVEAEEIKEDSPNDEFDKGIDDILGYGPIQDLIDSDNCSEIMVNGPDHVYIEQKED